MNHKAMSATRTPYRVVCFMSGEGHYLTEEEYLRQLRIPEFGWKCPQCGNHANWDDANYDEAMSILEAGGKLDDEVVQPLATIVTVSENGEVETKQVGGSLGQILEDLMSMMSDPPQVPDVPRNVLIAMVMRQMGGRLQAAVDQGYAEAKRHPEAANGTVGGLFEWDVPFDVFVEAVANVLEVLEQRAASIEATSPSQD